LLTGIQKYMGICAHHIIKSKSWKWSYKLSKLRRQTSLKVHHLDWYWACVGISIVVDTFLGRFSHPPLLSPPIKWVDYISPMPLFSNKTMSFPICVHNFFFLFSQLYHTLVFKISLPVTVYVDTDSFHLPPSLETFSLAMGAFLPGNTWEVSIKLSRQGLLRCEGYKSQIYFNVSLSVENFPQD
jgi:hypothetical protein